MKHQQEILLVGLERFYREKILCDVTLKTGSSSVEAHKCVLAASSSYFRAMFTFDKNQTGKVTVELVEVSGAVLEELVDYFYTGDIHLTTENVQELVTAADMMQISSLRSQCEDFMLSALCVENCVEIYNFADFQNLDKLKDVAQDKILSHFGQLVDQDEFLNIQAKDLINIVSCDELNVSLEEVVYEAVIKWIKHDLDNRENQLQAFVFSLRLPLMDIDYIEDKVLTEPLILNNELCYELIDEVRNVEKGEDAFMSSVTQFNLTPRLGMYNKKMLVFSGGSREPLERSFCCYDIETNRNFYAIKHHPLFDFKNRIDLFKLVTTESNDIYFLGGVYFDDYHSVAGGTPARSSVLVFNQSFSTWEERTPMVVPKCAFGVCYFSKQIYVFGGYSMYPNYTPHKDVSSYDIDSDEWSERENMPVSLAHHSVAVYQDKALVFGGMNSDNQMVNTILEYTFNSDQWTLLQTRIPKAVSETTALVHQNQMFILGGCDSAGNNLSVLIFKPEKNRWKYGDDFPDDRKFTSVTGGDRSIYVCGGQKRVIHQTNKQYNNRDLFVYDITTNQWSRKTRLVEAGNNYTCIFALVNTKYLKETDKCS